MLEFLKKYGRNYKFSQNLEEGLTEEIFRRMGITQGICVEIGGADGQYCSNTALLIESGWRGTFVETQFSLWEKCRDTYADNPRVKSVCSHVDRYNINAFVDDSCDVFSTDTDGGSDYAIFKAMKARPKIVIIEVDSSFLPDDDSLNADGACGYGPMLRLAIEKSFFLLAHTGNLVLCANEYRDLFPEIVGDGVSNSELYFNRSWVRE